VVGHLFLKLPPNCSNHQPKSWLEQHVVYEYMCELVVRAQAAVAGPMLVCTHVFVCRN